jgi:hypothetical protein
MGRQLLIDTLPIALSLEEAADGSKKLKVRGEFARVDTPTQNKRVYPKSLMEREINRLASKMQSRGVFGELDHPADGKTSLSRVSHFVTNLTLDSEGNIVAGEAEPIPGKRAGDDLIAMLEAGAQIGVSSRGYGSVRSNERGEDVVQDDYRLVTFDFVADPADAFANPRPVWESKMELMDLTLNELEAAAPDLVEEVKAQGRAEAEAAFVAELLPFLDFLREHKDKERTEAVETRMQLRELIADIQQYQQAHVLPEAVEAQVRESLREEFEAQLALKIAEAKDGLRAVVVEEVRADPAEVRAAKTLSGIVEALKPFGLVEGAPVSEATAVQEARQQLDEQAAKIAQLESDLDKALTAAHLAGYNFRLEKLLAGCPDAEAVRRRVGDIRQYESIEQLDSAVTSVMEEFAANREALERARQEGALAAQEAEALAKTLREENEALRKALNETTELTKGLAVKSYIETRLQNHPNAVQLRAIIESRAPQSKAEVDAILEATRDRKQAPDLLESARARVRDKVGAGLARPLTENADGAGKPVVRFDPLKDIGLSLTEAKQLSGFPQG